MEEQNPNRPPKVSIVMPVYNQERYVDVAIESVLAQSFRDWELVCVDDGSTDLSREILERHARADGRIRVIVRENGGQSRARNTGLDACWGEVVMFLDSDDAFHPWMVERSLTVMNRLGADVVVHDFKKTDHIGRPDSLGPMPEPDWERMAMFNADTATECSLYQRPAMNSVCCMAIRHQVLEADQPLRFKPDLYYEDLEISDRIFSRSRRVVHVPEAGYLYRQQPDSFIHRFNRRRLDALKVTEDIERRMAHRTNSLRRAAFDRRFSANFNIMLLIDRQGQGEFSREAEECWALVRERRLKELLNPHVRPKNRLGALMSYGGRHWLRLLARLLNP